MDVHNQTPFPLAPLPGRIGFPGHSLTLIIKGTFDLVADDVATVAEEQMLPTGDEPFPDDEDAIGGPWYESDFAYRKAKTDLMLVGHCHPPNGQPVTSCPARFTVGTHTRGLMVFGDRYWQPGLLGGKMTDPTPFSKMALRAENAFGGPKFKANPVGKGMTAITTDDGAKLIPLPNIEDPSALIKSASARPGPAGFWPRHKQWSDRQSKLGTYKKDWLKTRWPWFPDDFDWTFFNAAHESLQVEAPLRGDERMLLENLHPERARFTCHLPGTRVRCFVLQKQHREDRPPAFVEVPLALDTLWLDIDHSKVVLVWRGHVPVANPDFDDVVDSFVIEESLTEPPESLDACRAQYFAMIAEEQAELNPPAEKPPPFRAQRKEEGDGDADEASAKPEVEKDEEDKELDALELQMREVLIAAGHDPDDPPKPSRAEVARAKEILKEHGYDEEEVDSVEVETAAVQWSRERVAEHHAAGESFHGESLRDLDLSNLDLTGIDLSKADLRGTNLSGTVLTNGKITEAQLAGADFSGAELSGVNAAETDFTESILGRAIFDGADLTGAHLAKIDLTGCSFQGAQLESTDLSGATLNECDATKAYFAGSDMTGCEAKNAVFMGADLSACTLVDADLSESDLSEATLADVIAPRLNLSKATVTGLRADGASDLSDAILSHARGEGPIWSNCDLSRARLDHVEMDDALFMGTTLDDASLRASSFKHACFAKASLQRSRLLSSNFFEASFERADMTDCDLSGSNCYAAEFLDAVLEGAGGEQVNVKMSKLANR